MINFTHTKFFSTCQQSSKKFEPNSDCLKKQLGPTLSPTITERPVNVTKHASGNWQQSRI